MTRIKYKGQIYQRVDSMDATIAALKSANASFHSLKSAIADAETSVNSAINSSKQRIVSHHDVDLAIKEAKSASILLTSIIDDLNNAKKAMV